MSPPRWVNRPDGANWGEYGADDEFGRLNLLTPERVQRAAAEIRDGRSFCLSLPLTLPGGNVLNPRRKPPRLQANVQDGHETLNFAMEALDPANTDVLNDDHATLHLQYSTQWDALAHIGGLFDADGDGEAEKVYYNGYREADVVAGTGARKLAVDTLARKPVQGRGVLVDLYRASEQARHAYGLDELQAVMASQSAAIEEGDILVLRTGFSELIVEMDGAPDKAVLDRSCATLDGRDEALLNWISGSGIAAIAADNYAVEQYPAHARAGRRAALPLHEHCLFKLGLPLGELWYLKDLAEWLAGAGRTRFFLTAPALNLPGAVGSPVTPVATV